MRVVVVSPLGKDQAKAILKKKKNMSVFRKNAINTSKYFWYVSGKVCGTYLYSVPTRIDLFTVVIKLHFSFLITDLAKEFGRHQLSIC